jgi:hypothetical protein
MATPELTTDSGKAHEGGRPDSEGTTRTLLRVALPEEILQALRRRAEQREVSVVNFAAYLLTRAVMED